MQNNHVDKIPAITVIEWKVVETSSRRPFRNSKFEFFVGDCVKGHVNQIICTLYNALRFLMLSIHSIIIMRRSFARLFQTLDLMIPWPDLVANPFFQSSIQIVLFLGSLRTWLMLTKSYSGSVLFSFSDQDTRKHSCFSVGRSTSRPSSYPVKSLPL
jgi:hypothetical protein